jgi:hypothetical protein
MRKFECPHCHATVKALAKEMAHRCTMNRNRFTDWKEIITALEEEK